MIDIVALTLKELVRRRFIAGAAVATGALVAVTGWGFTYLPHIRARGGEPVSHLEVLTMTAILLILIAYLFSFLLAMAAVFVAAPSIAADIESGVLLPVIARPITRTTILGGKAIALAIVIAVYTFVTGACEFAVVRAATGYLPPHPAAMLAYLALSGIVMVALALLLGTRMPALAASIVAMGLFIIARLGGIAQSIGLHYGNDTVTSAGTFTQLLLPSDAMWQAALYRLEPASMIATLGNSQQWPGPFFILSPPPLAVLLWTIGWIAVIVALSARSFELRDL
jgi:ABC-type transport system involved in multi-copper enzyme maturation permease subunit